MLFPDNPNRPALVGIARLAASSEFVVAKRRVEYFALPTRRYITRCSCQRTPFEWTINPYRGCEFGCKYCYARYTHEFMELRDGRLFEEKIYAKQWNAAAFRSELRKIPRGDNIALGTATDPYQPAERRFRVTRFMLAVFAKEGHKLWITTKSNLVTRDVDLLREVARRNVLQVNVTVTTMDQHLARLLEPFAPLPDLRIQVVRELTIAGIRTAVFSCPILPLLNDREASLERVARAAAQAGAASFGGHVVFLEPCAYNVFLPFLEQHFPHLVHRYRERFERSAFLRGEYPQIIQQRLSRVRERHGLNRHATEYIPELWGDDQLPLFP